MHKSEEILERMDELGFGYIFGPAYSPDFNPVETIFSMAKSYVKKERLCALINGYEIDLWKLIHKAFDVIDVLKVVRSIEHSDKLLYSFK